jgi:drug/metabolite transporter (DMT)-like permease
MLWLVLASLLWAFSFGLIKRFLPGLDPWWVAAARLLLATAAFSPWLVRAPLAAGVRVRAVALGALQFGLMYVCYLASYRDLAAWQVALWTVFTPVMVVLAAQIGARRWQPVAWIAALVAVGGAMIAQGRWPTGDTLRGVLLVQASNLAFALGQLGFAPLARRAGVHDAGGWRREAGLLGWMYLGGTLLATGGALVADRPLAMGSLQQAVPVVLYLGLVPTALGFWLWNKGAARLGAEEAPAGSFTGGAGGDGSARLAVANNLKIPLAVVVAWTVFGESAAYGRALLGLAVITGVLYWLSRAAARTKAGPGRR